VTSSTVTTGASVPLSALGFDFTVTVSGSSAQTVSSGQTASYTLVITPLSGSQGTFTYLCGTLPADAACTFNPTSETLNAVAGNVIVQISTGSGTSGQLRAPGAGSPFGGRNLPLALLPLLCGVILLPPGWSRRQKALMLAALLAILAGGMSSCTSSGGGSGGGGGSGKGTTPSGAYTITVTVSSNGIQHSVNLTLTVD
jgi:hypothetical protein